MDDGRRAWMRMLAAAGLLEGAGLGGLVRQALANGNHPLAAGIRDYKGTVLVNGVAARAGMLLKAGDTVTTGPGSEATYVIGDNAFLQRDNSSVVFGDAASGFFRLVTGKLLSVFGSGPKRLQVSTATIGIRGTACYIESTPDLAYFCLCYGEAEVVPNAAPQEREVILTRHHDHPITIGGNPSATKMMAPAEVINHTDAELTLLESLVGRRPPFYNSGRDTY